MKNIVIALLLLVSIQANASCRYEARVRLGLSWYTVDIKTEKPLTRREVISRLAQKYNFNDVGAINEVTGCQ
jgi:hypothetical protein